MILWLSLISLAEAGRNHVGGYFRVQARPDLQGGSSQLGYWNLYGRLLNEGSYATLDFRHEILERNDLGEPWTAILMRVEGGSIGNADSANGVLSALRLSQVFVQAGNLGNNNITWQVGTLENYFGDLGLYDFRPSTLFFETVGVSARYQTDDIELLLAAGDSGYRMRQDAYNTVLTGGGSFRWRVIPQFEFGFGGQYRYEPGVEGNINAPYATPNIDYDDYLRGEVVQNYMLENPLNQYIQLPNPILRNASSYKAIGYIGFGNFGPVIWNNFYASYELFHPDTYKTETFNGQTHKLFLSDLTDERYSLFLGNEIQLRIIPKVWDIAWGAVYGDQKDLDNQISPSDYDRTYASTVLRSQWYLTERYHLLVESSVAKEVSRNGNAYREHADSIFKNTGGSSDPRGFEYGDSNTRTTFQGKGGIVINPMGRGIYTRPSLRFLYGAQYSNQNNAFGNAFVESLNQFNQFGNVEQHWHHILSLEMEAWF
ncbi:MAG: hypothetical protein CMK59_11885 [Proteobacteria bacterium]|nr:hypothetical protein [Pseudomonadota bacterium]